MAEVPLELVAQATADAAGDAVARFAGVPPWHTWTVRRLTVTTDSAARTAATVYRDSVAPQNKLDPAPYSGNDDTTDTVFRLDAGTTLVVAWSGADVGARCLVTISGDDSYRGG